ncbi:MAG: hypothetical protein CVU52_10950 [Deltaproteobacteria bacterium HGW-Deltaproteobacteria-10]|nr:MAG: hypothetical protein CVU52_10950 [Deltaproteobacteria bacterium HGW-Deltaproteobacteria-10]
MDYMQMTAPCGLDCFNCMLYQASGNEQLRKVIADKMQIPLEDAACNGCRAQGGQIAAVKMTVPCKVYQCISQKGISFCCDCSDFPCDHLHPYADLAAQRPHNIKVYNLCLIKKMGLERWAEEKAKSGREKYFQGKLHL